MPVTSADVAKVAGVSRATVSYVVNGKDARISPETRRAVLDAADQLGYKPLLAARALVTGQSNVVLMVVPTAANSAFLENAGAFAETFAQDGKTLLVMPPASSADTFGETLRAIRPCAVISFSVLPLGYADEILSSKTRHIDIGEELSGTHGANWEVGRMQADHLIARGVRELVYVNSQGAKTDRMQTDRRDGFSARASELGFSKPKFIDVKFGQQVPKSTLQSLLPRSGLACFNDDVASVVLASAHLAGLSVPTDLAVIGVDDTDLCERTVPTLTSVSMAFMRDGKRLLRRVQETSEDKTPFKLGERSIELIQRQSS